jgi:hypothetical protein
MFATASWPDRSNGHNLERTDDGAEGERHGWRSRKIQVMKRADNSAGQIDRA